MEYSVHPRPAVRADTLELSRLIEESVRSLQRATYTPRQVDLALAHVYRVDTRLVDDGTYLVAEAGTDIVGCGGWSRRANHYGGECLPIVRMMRRLG